MSSIDEHPCGGALAQRAMRVQDGVDCQSFFLMGLITRFQDVGYQPACVSGENPRTIGHEIVESSSERGRAGASVASAATLRRILCHILNTRPPPILVFVCKTGRNRPPLFRTATVKVRLDCKRSKLPQLRSVWCGASLASVDFGALSSRIRVSVLFFETKAKTMTERDVTRNKPAMRAMASINPPLGHSNRSVSRLHPPLAY